MSLKKIAFSNEIDPTTAPSANSQIRLANEINNPQIHNLSWSFAETKYFTVAAREDTLEAPGTHRPAATFADETYGLPKYTSD